MTRILTWTLPVGLSQLDLSKHRSGPFHERERQNRDLKQNAGILFHRQ
jgi:hypothetical protein